MLIYNIHPGIGIGPVRLGWSPAEVRTAMGSAPHRFMKTATSEHPTDAWDAFHVYYRGSPPTVDFIELGKSTEFRVRYNGIDIFGTQASDLIALLSAETPYDPHDRELGYTYVFRAIGLSLWRPFMPESETDPDGQFFEAVSLGVAGYFSG
ncbi:MAG TPA: hypothetical protein VMQ73_03295 [Methylomirabilota bacterium]|nr:hypothetical protein [Methylomirabilota bacterium]